MSLVAVCLLVAHISYALFLGPENIDNNYFSGIWVIATIQFAFLVARPASNTTRIPAVIWIFAGLFALAFNYSVLS